MFFIELKNVKNQRNKNAFEAEKQQDNSKTTFEDEETLKVPVPDDVKFYASTLADFFANFQASNTSSQDEQAVPTMPVMSSVVQPELLKCMIDFLGEMKTLNPTLYTKYRVVDCDGSRVKPPAFPRIYNNEMTLWMNKCFFPQPQHAIAANGGAGEMGLLMRALNTADFLGCTAFLHFGVAHLVGRICSRSVRNELTPEELVSVLNLASPGANFNKNLLEEIVERVLFDGALFSLSSSLEQSSAEGFKMDLSSFQKNKLAKTIITAHEICANAFVKAIFLKVNFLSCRPGVEFLLTRKNRDSEHLAHALKRCEIRVSAEVIYELLKRNLFHVHEVDARQVSSSSSGRTPEGRGNSTITTKSTENSKQAFVRLFLEKGEVITYPNKMVDFADAGNFNLFRVFVKANATIIETLDDLARLNATKLAVDIVQMGNLPKLKHTSWRTSPVANNTSSIELRVTVDNNTDLVLENRIERFSENAWTKLINNFLVACPSLKKFHLKVQRRKTFPADEYNASRRFQSFRKSANLVVSKILPALVSSSNAKVIFEIQDSVRVSADGFKKIVSEAGLGDDFGEPCSDDSSGDEDNDDGDPGDQPPEKKKRKTKKTSSDCVARRALVPSSSPSGAGAQQLHRRCVLSIRRAVDNSQGGGDHWGGGCSSGDFEFYGGVVRYIDFDVDNVGYESDEKEFRLFF